MAHYKSEKIRELLKHLAAEFLERESDRLTMITVTDVVFSERTNTSTIFVTVFPENKEKLALDFVKRKRSDFRDFVKTKSNFRIIPFFDFAIDKSEKNRQRIERIIDETKNTSKNSQSKQRSE